MANVGNGPSAYVLTGNGTNAPPTWQPAGGGLSNGQVVLKAINTVDLTQTGTTLLYSNISATFIVTDFVVYGVDVTGVVSGSGIYSIGWVPPNYQESLPNYQSGYAQATGGYFDQTYGDITANALPLPISTDIYVNVSVAESTATTCVQQIYLIGYYLF